MILKTFGGFMIGCNIFIYDFDVQDGYHVRELALWVLECLTNPLNYCDSTIRLFVHTNDIDRFFKCFRCPSCDGSFNKSNIFKRYVKILWLVQVQGHTITQTSLYTLRGTLFEKLEGFNIPVLKDNKLFDNQAIFDFETKCVQTHELKATQTTTWIGKHVPIAVSSSSNLHMNRFFLVTRTCKNILSIL